MSFVGSLAARMRWVGEAKTPASAVVFSILSRVLILLINVLTGVIVARTLGPAGRGAAAAIPLWPVMLSGLLTLGVPASLRYQVRRRVDRPAEILSSAMVICTVLGVVAVLLGIELIPRLLNQYPAGVIRFAQFMLIFTPFMMWNAILQAFYESQGDFKRSNAMIYVPPVMTLSGLVVLYALHAISPFSVSLIYELPFALTTLATIVQLRTFLCFPSNLPERVRTLLHYGVRAYGIDLIATLAGKLDQALVVGLLSATSFGFYVVAINGSRIPSMIGASLNSVLVPTASGMDATRAIALVSRSGRIVFFCTLLAALAFMAALPILVPLAYGNEYSFVIGLTRILTIAIILTSTTATLTQAFLATGRPEIATMLQCAGLVVTVPLMLMLIPRFGLSGAAYAVVMASAIRFALVLLSYPLFLHHKVPRIIPTREDLRDLYQLVLVVGA